MCNLLKGLKEPMTTNIKFAFRAHAPGGFMFKTVSKRSETENVE